MPARCLSGELLRFRRESSVFLGQSTVALKLRNDNIKSAVFTLRSDPGSVVCLTQKMWVSVRGARISPQPFVSVDLYLSSLVCCLSGLDLSRWGGFSWESHMERKKQSLNSKSMFHSISLPLCVCACVSVCLCAFYELSSFLAHWRHCVFPLWSSEEQGSLESQLPVHTGVRQGDPERRKEEETEPGGGWGDRKSVV